jgi:ATP-binding cassette subfamily B protein
MMMAGWVSFSLMTIYTNLGDVQDAMQTLAVPHTMIDKVGAPDLTLNVGEIRFDRVSFTYGRNIGGLKDVSLRIKAGEKLGVVGASGAGKSTLVSTLLRLHDPESGAILIDGQNIVDVKQNSLRRNISMVTQEASMFNRTARENILYGKPDASEEEVVDAAKKAGAHEFISSLVDNRGREGYDAYLGERGVKLSGGQRQRIALARAIIKDAPILVLDEATSALDSEVEAAIQESLETVMAGKTVFAIAHRLSTISHMDRIVVMDEGRIIEEGTHNALLRKRGVYANFWERQSGGFLGVDAAA